jgi:hypothetical protein
VRTQEAWEMERRERRRWRKEKRACDESKLDQLGSDEESEEGEKRTVGEEGPQEGDPKFAKARRRTLRCAEGSEEWLLVVRKSEQERDEEREKKHLSEPALGDQRLDTLVKRGIKTARRRGGCEVVKVDEVKKVAVGGGKRAGRGEVKDGRVGVGFTSSSGCPSSSET